MFLYYRPLHSRVVEPSGPVACHTCSLHPFSFTCDRTSAPACWLQVLAAVFDPEIMTLEQRHVRQFASRSMLLRSTVHWLIRSYVSWLSGGVDTDEINAWARCHWTCQQSTGLTAVSRHMRNNRPHTNAEAHSFSVGRQA